MFLIKMLLAKVRQGYPIILVLLNRFPWYLFLAIGLLVFFYTPLTFTYKYPFIAIIFGLILCSININVGYALYAKYSEEDHLPHKSPLLTHFIAITLFGIALRILWIYFIPPRQLSDFLSYWNTAIHLSETWTYTNRVGEYVLRAWLPPGYPFFLAVCMAVIGQKTWIPAASNIFFYILTNLVVYSTARKISNKKSGLLALSFLALWPSHIAMTGLAATEPLSILIFTSILLMFVLSIKNGWWYSITGGILTGIAALIRAQFIAIPAIWIFFIISNRCRYRVVIYRMILATSAMLITIAPWSIRNYILFGDFIAISTNGGSVFYRANNPLSSGGFTHDSEHNLNTLLGDEVLLNHTAYALGMEWIQQNPFNFLKLMIKKQLILLGEDTTGIYWTIEKGHDRKGWILSLLKLVSNLWWISIWSLAVIGSIRAQNFFINGSIVGLLPWTVIFLIIIHSIYESQPRYHMPFVAVLSIISAFAIFPPRSSTCRFQSS